MDYAPWQQYRRPFVRDLAYAIACPNALKHWVASDSDIISAPILVHSTDFWQQQYQQYQSRLQELDSGTHYQQLTKYLMSRPSPYRLGFHFEGLMHFWLEDGYRLGVHPYEVLAHNVQLYDGKQTIGELDFILRNHDDDKVEHWELAIKFYIGSPPFGFADWVGINARDNLARKLNHMQSKQFRSVWVDLDDDQKVKIDKRYAVLKGRFFRPATLSSFERPHWLNPDFPLHKWYEVTITENTVAAHDTKMAKHISVVNASVDNPSMDNASRKENENNLAEIKNLDDEDIDSFDNIKINEATHTTIGMDNILLTHLRPTHYIEWFTERPFYTARIITRDVIKQQKLNDKISNLTLRINKEKVYSREMPKIQNDSLQYHQYWPYKPLTLSKLHTGLYMDDNSSHQKEGEPIVLLVNGQERHRR